MLSRKPDKGQGGQQRIQRPRFEGVDHNGHRIDEQNAHGRGQGVVQAGALAQKNPPHKSQNQGRSGKKQHELHRTAQANLRRYVRCRAGNRLFQIVRQIGGGGSKYVLHVAGDIVCDGGEGRA